MQNNRIKALRNLENLFLVVYFFVLFGERTASVISAFMYADFTDLGFFWLYAHIAATVSLIVFLAIGMPTLVRAVARIFSPEIHTENHYRMLSCSVGVLLVSGMIHTDNTVLWLQFTAYGGLLLSMLLRSIGAAGNARSGVTTARLVVSYLYILCFSMAIPVAYEVSLPTAAVFYAVEIITSLFLVFAFTVMLDGFYSSGGLVNFNFLLTLLMLAANAVILALRWTEAVNYFLIIFSPLTALLMIIGRVKYGNHQLLWFYGYRSLRPYFEGWYFKLQNEEGVLAFIVSYHRLRGGDKYAMLQVVTDGEPLYFQFPIEEFSAREDMLDVRIGNSRFGERGMTLDLDLNGHSIKGEIAFGEFNRLKNDIMGFFANFPLMQCKHGIVSMRHKIGGKVIIDGKTYDFDNGLGYIEKDRGNSFPSHYNWTQAVNDDMSLMLAVARIPYGIITFTGCIGVVEYKGKEYRLATYNGVRVRERNKDRLVIERGKKRLTVTVLETSVRPLAAPSMGEMSRTIHESPASKVRCELTENGKVIFDVTSDAAGFEAVE